MPSPVGQASRLSGAVGVPPPCPILLHAFGCSHLNRQNTFLHSPFLIPNACLREIRKAILLAAGRGVRLGALTADTPKPLLDIGGKPMLSHIIEGFSLTGIDSFAIVPGIWLIRSKTSATNSPRSILN